MLGDATLTEDVLTDPDVVDRPVRSGFDIVSHLATRKDTSNKFGQDL